MIMSARELLDTAAACAAQVFKNIGRITLMVHVITDAGEHHVIQIAATPDVTKDEMVEGMRLEFERLHAVAYCFIDEGWVVDRPDEGSIKEEIARIARHGVRNEPDRREVLLFTAEDANVSIGAWQSIIRPAKGKARLGPLEIIDGASEVFGRLVGLLPRPAGTKVN